MRAGRSGGPPPYPPGAAGRQPYTGAKPPYAHRGDNSTVSFGRPRYESVVPYDELLHVDRNAADPVRRQYREILGFVRRRVASPADAEDIAQEVFASAADHLVRSAGAAPPTLGWLYRVARRRLADEARSRRRPETVSLELVQEPEAPAEYGEPVAKAFDAALDRLTEGQRVVVLLRLIEGRSFADIARRVDATEEACRMRFMRGLEQLRTELEKEGLAP